MLDNILLQPAINSQQLKDAEAQKSAGGRTQSTRAHQRHITSATHCMIDNASNLACIPTQVANELKMTIGDSKDVLKFGSYSHDGSIAVHHLAEDSTSRYLPVFAVTATGTMAILPSSWLSHMGYELRIHPYERGFSIIDDSNGKVMYEDIPSTDGFHYVP